MKEYAVAVVGIGAVMPDAHDAGTFWQNILDRVYSIKEVPADRWLADLYYHPDPNIPDKTYSKIGSWVQGYHFNPLEWGIMIPPKVLANMDDSQTWAIAASRQALVDYGYPERPLDSERVAVILGNAMAGEKHYMTNLRVHAPDFGQALASLPDFKALPQNTQQALLNGMLDQIYQTTPPINEDTMPGELSNIIAGRVANVFNFGGANFVTDAACASSLAALQSAVEGLIFHQFDAVLTGGIDRNMGVGSFVKFSKIGALSPDGSRPYAAGANGFVMGEGAAVYLLKRLEDAERDQDNIYAVIRGIGSSSDGKGKGITAPNPIGQQRAIERAWKNAGVNPASVGLIEGHGTSTKVGDVVETNSLAHMFGNLGLPVGSVGLGSVKSNIGHLKSAAGAAGLLKVFYALHNKILPPSANYPAPNPDIDFNSLPFRVITETEPWERPVGEVRRAGVSAFGFGGTNFHVVVEEYIPGLLTKDKMSVPSLAVSTAQSQSDKNQPQEAVMPASVNSPYDEMLYLGDETLNGLTAQLKTILKAAQSGLLPENHLPKAYSPERLVIRYAVLEELIDRAEKALGGLENDEKTPWQAYATRGIYRGSGAPGKVAFLYPGQGSQYVNMLRDLCEVEPVVAETFRQADEIMQPLLGKPLTAYIFVEGDEASLEAAEQALKDTTITQPAVLTANIAITRLLAARGFTPQMMIGHSLGEYAALVTSGALSFKEALEVVSARGHAMAALKVEDNGCMAAVSAPIAQVEEILSTVDGYVVLANVNSPVQSVIGGNTAAVETAIEAFKAAGLQAVKIPVSHAFHTHIVAPASETLRQMIERTNLKVPELLVAANVTGEVYPQDRAEMVDMLADHIASPVQFVKGINTLYDNGARIFVEAGPKRVLNSLANDILKGHDDHIVTATNHPRKGGTASFMEAVCQLVAAGLGVEMPETKTAVVAAQSENRLPTQPEMMSASPANARKISGSVVVSGAGLGLPGKDGRVFDDENIERILNGDSFIEPLPEESRQHMLDRRVTRLVKSNAGAQMVMIDDLEQTIKLAGQSGQFDLAEEFGIPAGRVDALDVSTKLAMAAGVEALRDAGIPLVMAYKQTSTGGYLPDGWRLPPALADETGVIFCSAFPGLERMAEETERFYTHQQLSAQLAEIQGLLKDVEASANGFSAKLQQRVEALQAQIDDLDYHFDRKFIFRVLNMGHSQFAEYIGARGPNTAVNAACATTTHAISIAEDWIRAGRCRRVVIVAGDDVTDGKLVDWIGTGLLATGATTTEGDPRKAALPFDRRRNGMIMGMGAAALVVEAEDAVRERGMTGICEVLATDIANSAFHGTRLNVGHVAQVMARLVDQAEARFGIDREAIAGETMFMSHETYTPARGGSAAAEIKALRGTFGEQANKVLIANTKGYTGHTMGVGIEDVVAVKALQFGVVPKIANLDENFEPDPELGDLNLSQGGAVNVQYALRLGAGFGSQIAMTLLRRIPGTPERVEPETYQHWLAAVAGYQHAALEVVQRTLRIADQGMPVQPPMVSEWHYGTGPSLWAAQPEAHTTEIREENAPTAAASDNATTSAQKSVSEEEIKTFLLGLVSEKTGYPQEILEMELDLEADLGIDTVKQAELFSAVRAHFGIPRHEDLMLVEYNTLAKVVGFVQDSLGERMTEPAGKVETAQEPAPQTALATEISLPAQNAPEREAIKSFLLGLVSEKTGYPTEILDLELDLEADLGIDTVKQAELFSAVRTHFGIPRREDLMLVEYNTLNKVIGFVEDSFGEAMPQVASEDAAEETEIVGNQSETVLTSAVQETQSGAENAASFEEVKAFLLDLVSEKTGYPTDILDLELDLEADLGIDTVKQAELFSAVREHFGIPRREDLMLVEYNTLNKVIGFVFDSQAALSAPVPSKSPAAESVPVPEQPVEAVQAPDALPTAPAELETEPEVEAFEEEDQPASILRKVPVPVLRPRLDLCVPTGITLDGSTRVLIVDDGGEAAEALADRLVRERVQVLRARVRQPEALTAHIQNWLADGEINGVYFLPSLDEETPLWQANESEWSRMLQERVMLLYHLMQALPEDVFLVTATRTGGLHGYGGTATFATGGGVSGFTKALARERSDRLIKVVDFHPKHTPQEVAQILVGETLRDPAVVEVGNESGQRFGISALEEGLPDEETHEIAKGSVFLVSGGTGGITLPVVLDLAKKTQGHFYLIGRSPLPEANDPDVVLLKQSGAEAVQKAWMQRAAQKGGEKPTPVQVKAKVAALERAVNTLDGMAQIEQVGGKASYLVGDVTRAEDVQALIDKLMLEEGKVDVLVHAAGFERSRKLKNKPLEEFTQTLDVKVQGFYHLFKALQQRNILPEMIALFSSVAGRYGNPGQTDYAAANDLLSKIGASLKQAFPSMRVAALDWGPWAEVGMASRGHTPMLMSQAGIAMMPPEEAAPLVCAELTRGGSHEAVLSGSLGMLEAQAGAQDVLDLEAANQALRAGEPVHVMLSSVTGYDSLKGVRLEVDLDPVQEPFLHDHAFNGTPLLPGVMGIEGFTVAAQHIASVLGAGDQYSFRVSRLEEIEFVQGIKFYRNEPRHMVWQAVPIHTAQGLAIQVRLESHRVNPVGKKTKRLHFKGTAYLQPTQQPLQTVVGALPKWNGRYTLPEEEIYKLYFHGPAFQVLEGVQKNGSGLIGKLSTHLPPMSSKPAHQDSIPRMIELCLQTAGIWEIGKTGRMSLPQSIRKVRLYRHQTNGLPIYAHVQPIETKDGVQFNSQVVDAKGRVYLELEAYRTVTLPRVIEAPLLAPLQNLLEE